WRVRPESHTCKKPPSDYLRRIFFYSLVYSPEQLEFLVRRAGAGQIAIGTDYPFDMGVEDPLERLEAATGLSGEDRAVIRGDNAARLLNIGSNGFRCSPTRVSRMHHLIVNGESQDVTTE